jgi:hypothetical protein
MNKLRKKRLCKVLDNIDVALSLLDSIMIDEEEYKDNMPENLQGSEKYKISETACDCMQEAFDSLESAIGSIEEIVAS